MDREKMLEDLGGLPSSIASLTDWVRYPVALSDGARVSDATPREVQQALSNPSVLAAIRSAIISSRIG